ncbi:MAG: DNA-directed RNA polymerase [Pleopsidium flavum]|nr:MAG: DNA-directed RNA polymerase [Pleopsidium flavum]
MLVRAARRKVHRDASRHLQPAFEQLRLPWLCPAQLRYESQTRKASTVTLAPTPTSKGTAARKYADLRRAPGWRCLASAAFAERQATLDDYIPFEHGPTPPQSVPTSQTHWLRERNRSVLKDFDASSPLIINDSLAAAPRRFKGRNGVPGDLMEIHLTLDACLKVGNLQRAAALVQRLARIYTPESPQLLEAHNQYLRANVEKIIRYKDQNTLKALQNWFEVEIRVHGLEGDATTYALLLKASLQISQGPKMERTVRRYMELAFNTQLRDEALSLPILSEAELGLISQICPLDFNKADDFIFEPFANFANQDVLEDPASAKLPVPAIPEVRSMDQKGLGLDTLKKSLFIFSTPIGTPYPQDSDIPTVETDYANAQLLQQRLEEGAIKSAMERWREESQNLAKLGVNSVLQTVPVNALLWEWHSALTPIIRQELQRVDKAEADVQPVRGEADQERCLYGPFLRFLSPEKLAAVTILSVMNQICALGADRGIKLAHIIIQVGTAVQDESFAEMVMDRSGDDIWRGLSSADRQYKLAYLIKRHQYSEPLLKMMSQSIVSKQPHGNRHWPATVRAKVGAVLMSSLIKAAKMEIRREHPETGEKIIQRQPVFYHSYQYQVGKRVGVVRLNSEMVKKLSKEPLSGLVAKHLPMVVEPRPWKSVDEGGYLTSSVQAMRIKNGDIQQRQYAEAATEKGDMEQVFSGLDVLAKTSWKINRGVFNVMLDAWNSGEAIANLPPEKPDIVYPREPEASDDPMARKRWMREIKMAENEKSGLHSQRCFQNFQLEIARAFLHQTFYFPHNVDFRGRAYPIPPYLNHMGADNSRGLLMFAKGKQLDAVGLTWLKVHLSNVYGFDKASFQERQDFTMEHLTDIYDSATNPLNGRRWWLKAEDPWQCLAACIELKNALDSPDPTRFISHLAIHQDGTCNGLQHYAALGGDSLGARQVNLEPGDRPSDIYTAVAEMIKEEISEEAAQGKEVAKVLEGNISRKVVKATVMTNVYGVTYTGARRQVRKQLEDIMPNLSYSGGIHHGVTSAYVAAKIFKSLSTMFNGAHDIQYWLGECANRISQALTPEQVNQLELEADGQAAPNPKYLQRGQESDKVDHAQFKSSVVWTTPLRMPVVQPYRKSATRSVDTNLQRVSIVQPAISDPVNKRKQLQGFPPNFIHSLDATHMLLSALKCDEVGLTFAAVHDSFWTHASDVDTMNRILRDAFIRMHSEDIVGRLAAEFAARYKGCMYLASVNSRSAVGKRIRKTRSAHRSKGSGKGSEPVFKTAELLREHKRLKLLASENPAEREEGRKLITPGSVFDGNLNEKDLAVPEELSSSGIGDMPARKTKLMANEQLDVGDISNTDTVEAATGLEMDDDVETTPVMDGGVQVEGKAEKGRKPKAKSTNKTYVWLPLTFPPVPKKGDFDVSRLKDSQYFFS